MLKYRKIELNSLVGDWSKVLDVWCANWALANHFDSHIEYYGVDYNQIMLENCKKKWLHASFCDLNLWHIDFKDKFFDLIYCSHVIEHFNSDIQRKIFSEFSRLLKKGGKILIYTPTWYHWSFIDDETHTRPHSHVSLSELAKNTWFKIIKCRYSFTRLFPDRLQNMFRLPPTPFYLTEVFLIAEKEHDRFYSKEY